ncbi:MAG: AAA family ATPase, partial [Chloroflexi bacterium]|nr:AAA family ATPase [Chloroflexota bacterium]
MPAHGQTPAASTRTMRRVYIIGLSGSGKTTLSARLARRYGLLHIEIDALNWGPGWQMAPKDELLAKVQAIVGSAPAWVADGNYSVLRSTLWQAADT